MRGDQGQPERGGSEGRSQGPVAPADPQRADDGAERELAEAVDFAETSPFPQREALYTHVYAGK